MIEAILFDADGVLINGREFSFHLEKDYGITREITTPFFTGPFLECLVGKADLKEVLSPYIKEWGWKGSGDEFLEYWFKSEHIIDQDLIKYIQDLRKKGIKCYLATNQEKHRAQYMLDKMGFSTSFDKVYASSHLGHRKPDLEFFAKVMEDLGNIQKEAVLFWDDTPSHIDAAKGFGINAEIYTTFEDFKAKMPQYLI